LESAKVLLRYFDQNPDRLNVPGITLAFEHLEMLGRAKATMPSRQADLDLNQKKRVPKKSK
jgi:hypothetical protein